MRKIYLIRHGEPAFPDGKKICFSKKDLPLSRLGRMQGVLLKSYFAEIPLAGVFHTNCARTKETALLLTEAPRIVSDMEEIGVGEWEGLTFGEIKQQYPELYRLRGTDPISYVMPSGEPPMACYQRVKQAFFSLLEQTDGDIAVTAHAGVNRLLLSGLLKLPLKEFLTIPQPYGCINVLCQVGDMFHMEAVGLQPHPKMDEDMCGNLLEAACTPANVQTHCRAVAERAYRIIDHLTKSNPDIVLEGAQLLSACLLHDIARTEHNHAAIGAEWINELGYPEISEIIACHHDLDEEQETVISEKTVLYLADKQVRDFCEVSLEERFAASLRKCKTEEAREAHRRRYEQAKRVEQLIMGAITESRVYSGKNGQKKVIA